MKKILAGFAAVAASVIMTGCGGPKIPANTVAAAYVDLDKTVCNIADVVDEVIDELPAELKKEARAEFKKFMDENKKNIKALDLDWAVVTVGASMKDTPEVGLVIKCNLKGKLKNPKSGETAVVKDMLEMFMKEVDESNGLPVYSLGNQFGSFNPLGGGYVSLVKDKYIIVGDSKKTLSKLVRLYKDGEGETTDDFDDLDDLGGDTIARVMTAKVETVVDILGVEDVVKKYVAEEAGDKELAEMILDIGNVALDLNFSDDVFGLDLTVDAGSRKLAKVVESIFNLVEFANRLAADSLPEFCHSIRSVINGIVPGAYISLNDDTVKALSKMARDAVEVDRSGSKVNCSISFDMDDYLEVVVPAACK